MKVQIEPSWKVLLKQEFDKSYFKELASFVRNAYTTQKCFPPGKEIFAAFEKCPLEATKVVILGQDPYHGPNQAHGLCFSVNHGIRFPPSLMNIFKEIEQDCGIAIPSSGNLERWANQGVLLLNSTLTVEAGKAGSHQNKGWETFTDAVIKELSAKKENLVFLLWGTYAQNKGKHIDKEKHLVLKAKHPSPLSANFGGWFGQKHFSTCNSYLIEKGLSPINW